MTNDGETPQQPKVVNLKTPAESMVVNGMTIDMRRFAEAANELGAEPHDVLSIGGYINAKGERVPDYTSIRIEDSDEHG